jgi:crotonobetainyl-CoA:carnitine CoA-transferase CaiB-like acyl-CoA transferase
VLAALLQRGITGKGSLVDVSMLEATVEWMGFRSTTPMQGPRHRRGRAPHATIYPYGPFEAGDGKTIMMAIQNSANGVPSASASSAALSWPTTRTTPATRSATPTATSSARSSQRVSRS